MWKTVGVLSTVGLAFVLAIVLGTAAGVWVDRRFGTAPLGLLVGFGMGLAAGVLNVIRITRDAGK
jgi:F0F1-type ATP synthase assembly protein I